MFPEFSKKVGGARRWLAFGGFSFQPSELAKFTLVLFIAKSLVKPSDFKFVDEADSNEYLSKWKSLKMDQQKPYSIKRFKPYS